MSVLKPAAKPGGGILRRMALGRTVEVPAALEADSGILFAASAVAVLRKVPRAGFAAAQDDSAFVEN